MKLKFTTWLGMAIITVDQLKGIQQLFLESTEILMEVRETLAAVRKERDFYQKQFNALTNENVELRRRLARYEEHLVLKD
jgi:hypothetical protein